MPSINSRLLAVTACLLWATAFLGVKIGLQYMPPLFFAGIRFTLAGLLTASVYRSSSKLSQMKRHWKKILLVGSLQTFGLYSLFFYSLTLMRASTGAIVNGLGPLIVAVAAHFFIRDNRLNLRQLFCLILAVAGVMLVSLASGGLSSEAGNPEELKGILLMLTALFIGAAASIVVAKSSDDLDPFLLNAGQLGSGGIMLLILSFILGEQSTVPEAIGEFSLALMWLVIVSSAGFSIWYYLLKIRKESLAEMAVWRFLIPMAGALISWIFLKDDNPEILSLAGMFLTGIAIYLFYRSPRSKTAS